MKKWKVKKIIEVEPNVAYNPVALAIRGPVTRNAHNKKTLTESVGQNANRYSLTYYCYTCCFKVLGLIFRFVVIGSDFNIGNRIKTGLDVCSTRHCPIGINKANKKESALGLKETEG